MGKAHGLAGDVYVWVDVDLLETLAAGLRCAVGDRELTVQQVRSHRGRPVVRFEGIAGRAAAEELRGQSLDVDRSDVTVDGAVWAEDLLGRRVVDADGTAVGTVGGLLDGAAHDFLVITAAGGGDILVPVVDALVDLDDPVVVHGPPGLLDPDQAAR